MAILLPVTINTSIEGTRGSQPPFTISNIQQLIYRKLAATPIPKSADLGEEKRQTNKPPAKDQNQIQITSSDFDNHQIKGRLSKTALRI